jgi:hypothetical protein
MASPARVISRVMVSTFLNVAACHRSHDECSTLLAKVLGRVLCFPVMLGDRRGRRLRHEQGVRDDSRP